MFLVGIIQSLQGVFPGDSRSHDVSDADAGRTLAHDAAIQNDLTALTELVASNARGSPMGAPF